jgi:hypothetical protein
MSYDSSAPVASLFQSNTTGTVSISENNTGGIHIGTGAIAFQPNTIELGTSSKNTIIHGNLTCTTMNTQNNEIQTGTGNVKCGGLYINNLPILGILRGVSPGGTRVGTITFLVPFPVDSTVTVTANFRISQGSVNDFPDRYYILNVNILTVTNTGFTYYTSGYQSNNSSWFTPTENFYWVALCA